MFKRQGNKKKISKTKKNKASIRHLREIKSTRNVRYATRKSTALLKTFTCKNVCELSYHERILSSLYTEKKSMLWKCNNVLRIRSQEEACTLEL